MTLKAIFTALEERDDIEPGDKLVEAVTAYKLEHPEVSDSDARSAVFAAMPVTHKAYLNSNGEK